MTATGPLWLAVLACLGQGDADTARLDEPFRLHVGETMRIEPGREEEEGFSLSLTFASVARDSRCPEGVRCVRAGEAVVVFTVRADETTTEVRVEVPPGGSAEAPLGERPFRLRVDGLDPQARNGRRIEADAYVASVTVSAVER